MAVATGAPPPPLLLPLDEDGELAPIEPESAFPVEVVADVPDADVDNEVVVADELLDDRGFELINPAAPVAEPEPEFFFLPGDGTRSVEVGSQPSTATRKRFPVRLEPEVLG